MIAVTVDALSEVCWATSTSDGPRLVRQLVEHPPGTFAETDGADHGLSPRRHPASHVRAARSRVRARHEA